MLLLLNSSVNILEKKLPVSSGQAMTNSAFPLETIIVDPYLNFRKSLKFGPN
jgi:hypothetical protein